MKKLAKQYIVYDNVKLGSNIIIEPYAIIGIKDRFHPESPLEIVESCDSNRLYDNGLTQRVAFYPFIDSYAVDTPEDAVKVEKYIKKDPYWVKYNNTAVQ